MLIAKVIVSALFSAQQETLQFHHVENKTKKARSFWAGCAPVIPCGVCGAEHGLPCPSLCKGSLLSVGMELGFLLAMRKCALDHRCPSSSDLLRPGFGRQDGCISKAGSRWNDAIPCVAILPVPGRI